MWLPGALERFWSAVSQPQAAQLATMAAQPTSVAQQLGRIPAAAASGRRDAGAVASAAFTFDTPTPDSRRSHNPFVKSSRKVEAACKRLL